MDAVDACFWRAPSETVRVAASVPSTAARASSPATKATLSLCIRNLLNRRNPR
jgi:hypothetical protein